MAKSRIVPVTLVTGFLGAGKTTLLNHLLETESKRRFAIIENEFGDVGVDGSLIGAPADTIFELNDGCVCCTVYQDLIEVFKELGDRQGEFDHVLIETTGLADPGPVIRLFASPELRELFRLDGVVTVVDAQHIQESLDEVSAFAEQGSFAGLLILNKVDRLGEHEVQAIEERMKKLNPLALVLRTEHAAVDSRAVYELRQRSEAAGVFFRPLPAIDTHRHDDSISSVVVDGDGDVDVAALDLWLGRLARARMPRILRMKGLLAVPGEARRFVFNGVRRSLDVRPDRVWDHEPRKSRIVFIGKGLDPIALRTGFEACLVSNKRL